MTAKLVKEIVGLLDQRDIARIGLYPQGLHLEQIEMPTYTEKVAAAKRSDQLRMQIIERLGRLAEVAQDGNSTMLAYEEAKLSELEHSALSLAAGYMLGAGFKDTSELLAGIANRLPKKSP